MQNLQQNRSPRVWVTVDDGSKNFHPALKFGQITIFTRVDVSVFINTAEWMDDLATWVSGFDYEQDFLLLTGDPVLISAVSACIALISPRYCVLKWDRQERIYSPVWLDPGKAVSIYDK